MKMTCSIRLCQVGMELQERGQISQWPERDVSESVPSLSAPPMPRSPRFGDRVIARLISRPETHLRTGKPAGAPNLPHEIHRHAGGLRRAERSRKSCSAPRSEFRRMKSEQRAHRHRPLHGSGEPMETSVSIQILSATAARAKKMPARKISRVRIRQTYPLQIRRQHPKIRILTGS